MMTKQLARGDFFAHVDECQRLAMCSLAVPPCPSGRDGDYVLRMQVNGSPVKVTVPFCFKHLEEYGEQQKQWYDTGKEAVASEA